MGEGEEEQVAEEGSDDSSGVTNPLHFGLTVIHIAATLVALGISIIAVIYAMGVNCNTSDCKSLIYMTNTFFSTSKVGSLTGWAVATERSQFGDAVQYPMDKDVFAFSHYFECMATAQMADSVCHKFEPLNDYVVCLKNNTVTKHALDSCNALSTSFSQPWPTAEEYLGCIFRFNVMWNTVSARASKNVFRSCLAKTIWPFAEVQQGIDSPIFLGSFNWVIMLAVGMVCMTSFAVYTASPKEKGMVTYGEPGYFMRLGTLWIVISFVWHVAFFGLFISVAFRETTSLNQEGGFPTTPSTSVVSLFMIGACLFYFGAELCESRDFTFVVHVANYVSRRGEETHVTRHGHIVNVPNEDTDEADQPLVVYDPTTHHGQHHHHKKNNAKFPGKSLLGLPMPNPAVESYSISAEDVAKYYTPPLLPAWADGYLADSCILLGMAGASGHLTTDQSWNLFVLMFIYRILNMLIARFLYQCFMNNLSLTAAVNSAYHDIVPHPQGMWNDFHKLVNTKGESLNGSGDGGEVEKYKATPHLNIQVMALSTQLAAVLLFSAMCFIVFNADSHISEFLVFKVYFILAFMVPELIRILLHVSLQLWNPDPNGVPWFVLNVHFFVWTWDLIVRIVFVFYVILGNSSDPGTRGYLVEKSLDLMDTYLTALGVN